MKSFPLGALSFALAMVPAAGIAESQAPREARNEREAVHVQPRERSFAPGSVEDDDIQRKLENFNKAQQDLDKILDKKLIICRRC
jgi:ribosomal protein S20